MLKVENLSYTYPGNDAPTVKGVGFEAEKGHVIGFLGPSGAGKSTLQKIIIRLLSSYQGKIEVFGQDLKGWALARYYERIGVGFELPNHYLKLTARENLALFGSFYQQNPDFVPLMEAVGLATHLDKRVEKYSKGMKMRLNFVRALMHDPELIFLDEPTSGLDPVNARILKNIILEEKQKGKTILLTTHNMHDADELCDQVGFMVDGTLKAMDSPKNLKKEGFDTRVVVQYRTDGVQEKSFALEKIGQNEAFLDLIQNPSHEIDAIHTHKATLEEVFVKMTGTDLKQPNAK